MLSAPIRAKSGSLKTKYMKKCFIAVFVFLSFALGSYYFLSTSTEITITNPTIPSVSNINAQASEKKNILVLEAVSDDPEAQIKSFKGELDKLQNELNSIDNSINADVDRTSELKTKVGGLKTRIDDLEVQIKIDDINARLAKGKVYIQVSDGCKININASCLNARSSAGVKYKSAKKLRVDTVFLVKQALKGDDDKLWYQIIADPIRPNKYGKWFVSGEFVKEISVRESIPKSLPGEPLKRIEVDLKSQTLKAFEDDKVVMETKVSTGVKAFPTPKGKFKILYYRVSAYMKGADYDLPGVGFDLYITWRGVAFHGTYWHDKFGRIMSHGCINMPNDKAEWLYGWVTLDTEILIQ